MTKRVALLNDTYDWYHWGCRATSAAIRKRIAQKGFDITCIPIHYTYDFKHPPRQLVDFDDRRLFNRARAEQKELFDIIEQSDFVVVNGEGTLHHVTKISVSLLYMAYAAKRFFYKPVHIINHSVYPQNVTIALENIAFHLYKTIYKEMDFIAVREHISHNLVHQMGIPAALSFDCLPITVKEDHTPLGKGPGKRIVISGSISFGEEKIADLAACMRHMNQKGYAIQVLMGARAHPAKDDVQFVQTLKQHGFDAWELIRAASLKQWLDCIHAASVFVSGRFHHTLAAIFLTVPCVLLESNTPKNTALAETFFLDSPLSFGSDVFLEELINRMENAVNSDPVDKRLLVDMLERAEVNFKGLASAS